MAKKPPKKLKPEEIETEPDAWDRFTKAVDVLAHTPPKPHKAKPPSGRKPKKPKPQ